MNKKYLYFYVFCTGMAIAGIEIAASRLLSPFFGSSTFVWAIIITIIMLGLAIGYWWGGKVADRYHQAEGIYKIGLYSGIFIGIIPLLGKFLFGYVSKGFLNTPINVTIYTFIASLFLFLPAIVLLGFMSPYVTRVLLDDIKKAGNIAGNVYAISTFGSILGILITTFGMIPFWGTRETIIGYAIFIILISVIGLKKARYLVLIIIPVIVYFYFMGNIKNDGNIVYEDETMYQYVQVVKDGDLAYLVFDEGGGWQSVYNLKDSLSHTYYDYFIPLPDLIGKDEQNIAILGYAGGVIAKELDDYTNHKIDIDGVEIDKDVAKLAEQYFQSNSANIIIDDARNYITHTDKNYDLVVLDTYTRGVYIPYHLASDEFFNQIRDHLDTKGILAANIVSVSTKSPLLMSIVKTIRSNFRYVYIYSIDESMNYVVYASNAQINFSKLADIEVKAKIKPIYDDLSQLALIDENLYTKGQLLTDNKAPLEYLTEHLFFESIKQIN